MVNGISARRNHPAPVGQELSAEFFRIDQGGTAEVQVNRFANVPARVAMSRRNTSARLWASLDEASDLLARHPGGIGGADQRADRRAGDGDGLPAHSPSASSTAICASPRAAATKREREALCHRAPASLAKSQAVRQAGAPAAPWRRRSHWWRCHRARGRRYPAESPPDGRNCSEIDRQMGTGSRPVRAT